MTWIALISGLIKIVSGLIGWAHESKLITLADAQAAASQMKAEADALQQANQVREKVRADLSVNPDGLRAGDPWKRKD